MFDLVQFTQQNVSILLCLLIYCNTLRERHKLTRSSLLSPAFSPWKQLLNHGDDSSFLDLTAFCRRAFSNLVNLCKVHYRDYQTGRHLSLDLQDQVGLYLFYVCSRMGLKHLCMIFGIVPSTASSYLSNIMTIIIKALKRHRLAAIKFPCEGVMRELAAMTESREPRVKNVIGFVDGVAIPIQCSDDAIDQNANYNGHLKDTVCNNVLAFGTNGKIIHASINYPGSWHDSTVAQKFMELVIRLIGEYALCVDQGFPRSGLMRDRFVGPISKKRRAALAATVRDIVLAQHAVYVSLRQAAEWGMRALQGTFSRLKSRLTSNKVKRRDIIYSILLLHNFRTCTVGLNQIKSVFEPHYVQYMNLNPYDRIARYFA